MGWQYYVLAAIFCIAGLFHLVKPKAFMRVMPLYIPYHKPIVYISGVLEIAVGIALLFPLTKTMAVWILIIMLLSFLPVHIHMLIHKKASLNVPKPLLYIRLLLQFILVYWIYTLR